MGVIGLDFYGELKVIYGFFMFCEEKLEAKVMISLLDGRFNLFARAEYFYLLAVIGKFKFKFLKAWCVAGAPRLFLTLLGGTFWLYLFAVP